MVTSFALGRGFACGVQADGRIACWGDLSRMRGGGPSTPATAVSGYWSATAVQLGDGFGCYLRIDGRVLCFGVEPAMGLVAGPREGLGEPKPLPFLPCRMEALAVGAHHACASACGSLYCWGRNLNGQLGDGTTMNRAEPVQVTFESL
jgi:hypothetical protein